MFFSFLSFLCSWAFVQYGRGTCNDLLKAFTLNGIVVFCFFLFCFLFFFLGVCEVDYEV